MNHDGACLALRNHLRTLSVATTGTTTLSSTATGYARTTGSFVTDGFSVGMEVTSFGFTGELTLVTNTGDTLVTDTGDSFVTDSLFTDTPRVVTAVTALTMTVAGTAAVQAAAAGRSLSVLLPSQRAWENVPLVPVVGKPYVTEEYVPGPTTKITLGPLGEVEALPLYLPKVYVPSNTGRAAAVRYADAILDLFAPQTSITLANSTLRVRGDLAPYPGQFLQARAGWAVVPVTVPIRYRTANTI